MASKYRNVDARPMPKRPVADHLARFVCQAHGFVVDTLSRAAVWCRCGRAAKRSEA